MQGVANFALRRRNAGNSILTRKFRLCKSAEKNCSETGSYYSCLACLTGSGKRNFCPAPQNRLTPPAALSYNLQAITRAWVAKLADALDSGSSEQYVHVGSWVQVPSRAPDQNNTNQEDDSRFVLFFARDFFGVIVRLDQHL